jgi:hypothetical protein
MKRLKRLFSATLLALILVVPVLAGDVQTPGAAPPPPPPPSNSSSLTIKIVQVVLPLILRI